MSGLFKARVGGLSKSDPAPLYRQLQTALREAIEDGVLKQGEALPPERELADAYAISRVTLRRALDDLVSERLLERRQGAGTFVCRRVEKSFSILSSFSEDMRSRGSLPHSEWLEAVEAVATSEEVMALGVSPGSRVYRYVRIRFADGGPMAVEHSVIPTFCLPKLDAVGDSLYDALEREGCRPVRALQRLRAIEVDADTAARLQVETGDAALFIERLGFLADGRVSEFTRSTYRGDRYDFVAELHYDAAARPAAPQSS